MRVTWLNPDECEPPHRVARPEQVEALAEYFIVKGWDRTKPALVGYPVKDKIQLLSGSHRWAAAMSARLDRIPVKLVSYNEVFRCWGSDSWFELMQAPIIGE